VRSTVADIETLYGAVALALRREIDQASAR
jgi:hypothetical protein